jgi:predicted acetyltransferase
MELAARASVEADLNQISAVKNISFGVSPAGPRPVLDVFAEPFSQVVTDDETVIGIAAAFPPEPTVPGGAKVPTSGVTSVGVSPAHRRRGALRLMMERPLTEMREGGFCLAVLSATETTIYERFGYGAVSLIAVVRIDTRRAEVRGESIGGTFELVDSETAASVLAQIHDAQRSRIHGMVSRPSRLRERILDDDPTDRDGASALFHVVYRNARGTADGYVSYRVRANWKPTGSEHTAEVLELRGASPEVEVELWRFLVALDLTAGVEAEVSVDNPLRECLFDTRAIATTAVTDQVWVRLLDLPAALEQRTYDHDGTVVLNVRDDMFAANTGSCLLEVIDGAAKVRPVSEDAPAGVDAISADVSAFGALYLGGVKASTLGLARRLEGAVESADALFVTATATFCGVEF